ncbi:zinc finger protein 141-like isoform X19 [Maniola hyperantus]|uniref:zinc finger protein 141-like isoform X19 n=1 Tax=Aphantopus hyperantus TaxID=2795564 RepID=UPI003749FEE8
MAAKTSDWRPGPTVCRCCLSEGCYKDISTEYFWMGKREVYSEMLSETFDLSISYSKSGGPNSQSRLICEPCIARLRDAADFKRQVQECEKTFMSCLDPVTALSDLQAVLELDKEVKVEMVMKEEKRHSDDDFDDAPDFGDDDDYDDLDDQPLTKLASKIPKKEAVDVLDLLDNAKITAKRKSSSKIKSQSSKKSKSKQIATSSKEKPEPKKKKETPKSQNKFTVKEEVRENSRKLLKYSNICLFKSLKTKYQCYSCKEVFVKISNLREHSKTHMNPKISGNTYKNADISALMCILCSERCIDLTVLTNHLKHKHKIGFSSTENMFIPYKLEEGLNCVLCEETFNAFLSLSIHMNKHSTNHTCEICNMSFFNSLNLRSHRNVQHRFSKKCTMCEETFTDQYVKLKHMRTVHEKTGYKRNCVHCDKTFKYSYMLQEHKIRDHGAKRPIAKCSDCGKTFLSPHNLKIHIRSVHVKERNFVCDICGLRFFTRADQNRHRKTHGDVKLFSCSHCGVKLKSKYSWTRHHRKAHEHDRSIKTGQVRVRLAQ